MNNPFYFCIGLALNFWTLAAAIKFYELTLELFQSKEDDADLVIGNCVELVTTKGGGAL